ncbi:MAG: deoxyribose-phosphate aldolase [Eubacteriales bacterium]
MENLLQKIDHTILSTTATWEEVKTLCEEGLQHKTASVCVPPRYVKKAAQLVGKDLKVCTVIGFPNGYSTPEVKIFETEDAVRSGADEIDMVANLGLVKSGDWEGVLTEIREVKRSCGGRILKVIIETDLLSQEEKIAMCRAVSMSGADFIKTSTGFVGGGATVEDIALLKEHCSPEIRIKASGGIDSVAKAKKLVEAGAHRLGSSKLVGLLTKGDN